MKKYGLLITTLFWTMMVIGQTQKTFVKSFPNSNSTITVDVNGPVEVHEWDQPFVRVLTTVKLDRGTSNVLISIMKSGRYKLIKTSRNGTDVYTIGELNPLKYKGQVIKEDISYKIYVPNFTKIIVKGKKDLRIKI